MQDQTNASGATGDAVNVDEDLILQLNFVPAWARRPPSPDHYGSGRDEVADSARERGRDRGRDRDRRYDDRGGGRPPPRGRGGDRRDARRPERPERPVRESAGPARRDRREPYETEAPLPPVDVSFFPDRRQLAALVRQVTASRKAYPLLDVASLLMSKPEFCSVRIESPRGDGGVDLYQCERCKMVALDRRTIETHGFQAHAADFFDVEEKEGEEPAGDFKCVARCGFTGTLLGPPNHHSFAERVQEMHQTRFPAMPIETYRKRIEMVHDEAAVAQWKQESRKKRLFRLKTKGGADGEAMVWTQAQSYFAEHFAPSIASASRRAVLPADVARETPDTALLRALRSAWQREQRFPRSLLFSLRAAFKHMHLHVFKAGQGISFVNHTQPAPLKPEHAVDSIRDVLLYLRKHPGSTREAVVKELRPGLDRASPEVCAILQPLTWLIERGHIIEFFNGTLSVPLAPEPAPAAPAPEKP